jgi:hypothetical protein
MYRTGTGDRSRLGANHRLHMRTFALQIGQHEAGERA